MRKQTGSIATVGAARRAASIAAAKVKRVRAIDGGVAQMLRGAVVEDARASSSQSWRYRVPQA